jgi:hypothetical protein
MRREEEPNPVHPVVLGTPAARRRRSPQAGSVGVVLLACALPLAFAAPMADVPAASALVAVVAIAGLALAARLPRCSAVAPAAAVGASLPLVTGAVLSGRPVPTTVTIGAGLAAIGVSVWLLRGRGELEPWHGARGVLVSTAGAMVLLGAGGISVGTEAVAGGGLSPELVHDALQTFVPWSVLVAGSGWLRRSPAIALLVPPVVQAAVLAVG